MSVMCAVDAKAFSSLIQGYSIFVCHIRHKGSVTETVSTITINLSKWKVIINHLHSHKWLFIWMFQYAWTQMTLFECFIDIKWVVRKEMRTDIIAWWCKEPMYRFFFFIKKIIMYMDKTLISMATFCKKEKGKGKKKKELSILGFTISRLFPQAYLS